MFKCFIQQMKNQKGMTLIEIMVVVAIIGSIMALVTVNLVGTYNESRVDTTKINIKNIENALELYKRKCNSYPSTEQGLQALVEKPSSGKIPENYPPDGFMKRIPQDAWDKDFVYNSPGSAGHPFEIISLGEDEAEGGEGYAADIKNYELK